MMPGSTEQPVPLTDAEFSEMMEEFDRAGAWMMHQLQERKSIMVKHVIGLERQNLAELEIVERLAASIGIEAFEADVLRLAGLHALNPEATIQAIPVQVHPSIIGMSESVFQVLRRLCDTLVEREPALLQRPSYRCRNAQQTALPWELWLALVRHAREAFDPAGLDAEFLAGKLREGYSTQEAFDALISVHASIKHGRWIESCFGGGLIGCSGGPFNCNTQPFLPSGSILIPHLLKC